MLVHCLCLGVDWLAFSCNQRILILKHPSLAYNKKGFATSTSLPARSASDLASGLAAIGDIGGQQGAKRKLPPSLSDQHRCMVDKLLKLNNKMGKMMVQLDEKMPSLKRLLGDGEYKMLKEGLGRCREQRADTMDKVEDLKHFPGEEILQAEAVTQLGGLLGHLTEHCDALQESIHKYSPKPDPNIKLETANAIADQAAHVDGQEAPTE